MRDCEREVGEKVRNNGLGQKCKDKSKGPNFLLDELWLDGVWESVHKYKYMLYQ